MKRSLLILMLIASAGCTVTPRQEIFVPPAPERWTHATAPATELEVRPVTFIADPTLAALIEEALDANLNLAAAAARVERAAAQARIVGADLAPQAALVLDSGRRRQNFFGLPIPGAGDQILSTTTTTHGVGLNVSWEADLWGRLRSGRSAAQAEAEASAGDLDAARLSIAAQTTKAWVATLEAREQLELAEITWRNRQQTAERIGRRFDAGLAPAVELRLAQSNAALAAARLNSRQRQLDGTRRQLELILGRYPSGQIEPAAQLPDDLPQLPAGVPGVILSRRADLVAAERRLRAADHRVAQARAALYPQIRLTGSAGTSTNELSGLLDGDFSVWSFAGNLLQPLFQGGRLRSNVDLHEAIADESAAFFAQRVLEAYAEVEDALVANETLDRQVDALQLAAANATAAQRSAEERYQAGLTDYLMVLESQRQAFEMESQLLEARRQRLTARVDLYLALGGDAESLPNETEAAAESLAAAGVMK
jgi:outer membrane protein, multidrug efflux system